MGRIAVLDSRRGHWLIAYLYSRSFDHHIIGAIDIGGIDIIFNSFHIYGSYSMMCLSYQCLRTQKQAYDFDVYCLGYWGF